jgi:hypothetical protein
MRMYTIRETNDYIGKNLAPSPKNKLKGMKIQRRVPYPLIF